MKKALTFILLVTFIVSLASCGKRSKLPASYTTIPAPTATSAQKETEETTTESASQETYEYAEEDDELPEDEKKISEGIKEVLKSYKDENGYMPPEEDILLEAEHKVYEYAQKLEEAGEIEGCAYCDEGYSVSFFLNDGSTVAYIPEIDGYYSNGEDFEIEVLSLMSFWGKFDPAAESFLVGDWGLLYSNPGKTIKEEFPASSYNDYDSKTTLTDLRLLFSSINERNMRAIFLRCHGGLIPNKFGQIELVFLTQEKVTKATERRYRESLAEDTYVEVFNNNSTENKLDDFMSYAINSKFIDQYMTHVNGGLFFTTACHGAQDNGVMGNVIREKGFDTYVGATETIDGAYSDGVVSKTAEYLCEKDETGAYITIGNALSRAHKECVNTMHGNHNFTLSLGGKGAVFDINGDDEFRLVYSKTDRISRSSEAPKEENTSVDEEITTEEIVLESTNISEAEVESEETIDLAEETSDLTQIVQDSFEMWCDDEAWIFVAYWNGHYYAIFPWQQEGMKSWDYCESVGGHLATITSQNEQDMIYAFIHAAGDTYNDKTNQYLATPYFGLLYDENEKVWKWVTNEPLDYTNWDKEVFMYENEKERPLYATMVVADNYMNNRKWVSIRTSDAQAFLCEWDSAELYEKYLQERKK